MIKKIMRVLAMNAIILQRHSAIIIRCSLRQPRLLHATRTCRGVCTSGVIRVATAAWHCVHPASHATHHLGSNNIRASLNPSPPLFTGTKP